MKLYLYNFMIKIFTNKEKKMQTFTSKNHFCFCFIVTCDMWEIRVLRHFSLKFINYLTIKENKLSLNTKNELLYLSIKNPKTLNLLKRKLLYIILSEQFEIKLSISKLFEWVILVSYILNNYIITTKTYYQSNLFIYFWIYI